MACVTACIVCGAQILDDLYCSQECAAAQPCDLLARIKAELGQGHPQRLLALSIALSEETIDEILKGNWSTMAEFLENKRSRDRKEQDRAMQQRLDELEDYRIAQEAMRCASEARREARERAAKNPDKPLPLTSVQKKMQKELKKLKGPLLGVRSKRRGKK